MNSKLYDHLFPEKKHTKQTKKEAKTDRGNDPTPKFDTMWKNKEDGVVYLATHVDARPGIKLIALSGGRWSDVSAFGNQFDEFEYIGTVINDDNISVSGTTIRIETTYEEENERFV